MSNNAQVLRIVEMSEEKTSSDGRQYRTVRFAPHNVEGGILSTRRPSGKNVWKQGPPNGMDDDGNPVFSAGNPIYDVMQVGSLVTGSIETVKTKPYYIESENGEYQHPETGHPANKAETWTSVVFEGENIKTLARNNDSIELLDEDQGFQSTGEKQTQKEQEPEMSITG